MTVLEDKGINLTIELDVDKGRNSFLRLCDRVGSINIFQQIGRLKSGFEPKNGGNLIQNLIFNFQIN